MSQLLSKKKRSLRSEQGLHIVLIAISVIVLIMIAGFGIDVGGKQNMKQDLERAADAAVIAGMSKV